MMAKKVLSKCAKKSKQSQLKESKLQEAVDMYQHEQSKLAHSRKGMCTIAQEHSIPSLYKTITNRYNGG